MIVLSDINQQPPARTGPADRRFKMKVQIEFKKFSDRRVRVSLTVTQRGDFTTNEIFLNEEDWVTNSDFKLIHSYGARIANTLGDGAQADKWASDQIEALRKVIDEWRKAYIYGDYEIEI